MAAVKQSKSKHGRARQAATAAGRFPIVLWTAARSMLNSGHIGIGVAVLVCSQAIALTQRAADHDYDLPLADFCGGCRAGCLRIRC